MLRLDEEVSATLLYDELSCTVPIQTYNSINLVDGKGFLQHY